MSICKRCRGSGSLLRMRKGMPPSKWFKTCTNCAGTGVRPALKYLRAYERKYLQLPGRL